MKSILPDGKGNVYLANTLMPELIKNSALCRVTHSLIECGTERKIIEQCRGKSRDEIMQSRIRLGSAGCGIVEQVKGKGVGVKKGSRVAFFGEPWVNHSQYVVVPNPLLCPVPDGVEPECAAFMGLGAIALHAVRSGEVSVGDITLVIGAGCVGNLVAQMTAVAGGRVVISEPDKYRLKIARTCFSDTDDVHFVLPKQASNKVMELSDRNGADSVFVCVSTPASNVMDEAIKIVRPGGRIVIVGDIDIHVPREEFFKKEVEITITRAAGPGWSDMQFERDGMDYPIQHIRWTESGNLKETMRLISHKRLRLKPLIAGVYSPTDVKEAYKQITQSASGISYLIHWK